MALPDPAQRVLSLVLSAALVALPVVSQSGPELKREGTATSTVTEQDIESLPSSGRNLTDIIRQAPGVVLDSGDTPATIVEATHCPACLDPFRNWQRAAGEIARLQNRLTDLKRTHAADLNRRSELTGAILTATSNTERQQLASELGSVNRRVFPVIDTERRLNEALETARQRKAVYDRCVAEKCPVITDTGTDAGSTAGSGTEKEPGLSYGVEYPYRSDRLQLKAGIRYNLFDEDQYYLDGLDWKTYFPNMRFEVEPDPAPAGQDGESGSSTETGIDPATLQYMLRYKWGGGVSLGTPRENDSTTGTGLKLPETIGQQPRILFLSEAQLRREAPFMFQTVQSDCKDARCQAIVREINIWIDDLWWDIEEGFTPSQADYRRARAEFDQSMAELRACEQRCGAAEEYRIGAGLRYDTQLKFDYDWSYLEPGIQFQTWDIRPGDLWRDYKLRALLEDGPGSTPSPGTPQPGDPPPQGDVPAQPGVPDDDTSQPGASATITPNCTGVVHGSGSSLLQWLIAVSVLQSQINLINAVLSLQVTGPGLNQVIQAQLNASLIAQLSQVIFVFGLYQWEILSLVTQSGQNVALQGQTSGQINVGPGEQPCF